MAWLYPTDTFDHAKCIKDYEKSGIPVFKPYESDAEKLTVRYGGFKVTSFPVEHDVRISGFYITHAKEDLRAVFITDTSYCRYNFAKLKPSLIMVEANYSNDFISEIDEKNRRVLQSHMELQTTKDFISTNDNIHLRNVVLLHLSEHNSDKALFRETIQKITSANVYVAEKGMNPIELSLPF